MNASTMTPVRGMIFLASALLGITGILHAQRYGGPAGSDSGRMVGSWSGTRTENNPITGRAFTINFDFQFRSDGTYTQRAGFGRATILVVEGTFSLRRGSKPDNANFTHILSLTPANTTKTPSPEEINALQVADLPNVDATEQYVFFYDLAPNGAATLKDVRPRAESWGLQRLR
jgi:hypothetical protein